jgi:hypothetical protein
LVLAPAVLLVLLISHAGIRVAGATENEPSTVIAVAVSRGKLSVDARLAPLAQVLRAIGERAGLDVTLRGNLNAPVTQSFVDLELGDGIRRLADGHSLTLIYAVTSQRLQESILTGVWVIDGSPRPGMSAASQHAGRTPHIANPEPPAQSSVEDQKDNASVARDPLDVPVERRSGEIRALTDGAVQGSAGALARLREIAASDADPMVRRQAVAALGQLKGPEIDAVLSAALGDVDASVRARAVRGLRGSTSEAARRSLVEVLVVDQDAQVRFAAVRALTSRLDPTTLPALEMALSDPDPLVRDTAMRRLSWWKAQAREGR